jgi:type IV fimbrial biogenesis protein FimT
MTNRTRWAGRRPAGRGLTLVELLVAVVITVILLGVAAPSFLSAFARVRLEGMVNELSVDLQYARSAAIRRQAAVSLVTAAEGGFYTITSGNLILKMVILPLGTSLTGNVSVNFDPLRGTASVAQVDATSAFMTPRLRATTNTLGRVQLCAPNADFAGYSAC